METSHNGIDSLPELFMTRDRLFLLRPDFGDPAYPGRRFYC